MQLQRGRHPIIEGTDHPDTIYRALHESIGIWPTLTDAETAFAWTKIVQDAEGALMDGFVMPDPDKGLLNPDGVAVIYINPDDLALSLVAYGTKLLEDGSDIADVELPRLNIAIHELDALTMASRGKTA